MTTRLSKIARLPAAIREQLNRRLHNGELGKTILPWLNELPETKCVLAELFQGKPINHQNLSEWRYAGYQDWLQVQQRLEWYDGLTEQEAALKKSECGDAYQSMGSIFLFEIGQSLAALQSLKNPRERATRLQTLIGDFTRLQNAFNWARRVHLEWNQYHDQRQANPPPEPVPELEDHEEYFEDPDEGNNNRAEPETEEPDNHSSDYPAEATLPTTDTPEPIPGAPTSSRLTPAANPAALVLVETPASVPKADLQPPFNPIQPLAPTTPPVSTSNSRLLNSQTLNSQPPRPHLSPNPIRGRRFVCIEG
ncbi:MAG TPA: hypothetical protein VG938_01325 [Verrucomicrobiae bacterium]|nr:hypothetical protein [Verrucomicrobiae bacterium]